MYNGGFNYPLSKEFITELKRNDNERLLLLVNDNINNCNNLAFILEHLGYLPMNYDYSWIVSLTSRPLKSAHLRNIVRKQYPADFFNKPQKSPHGSFEVVCGGS